MSIRPYLQAIRNLDRMERRDRFRQRFAGVFVLMMLASALILNVILRR